MTIGERIKMQREAKGISQLELAQKSGYGSKSAISLIEAGKRDIPIDKVRKIANALEVTPQWLMGWADDPLQIKTDLELATEELGGLTSEQLVKIRDYIRFLKYEGSDQR